MTAVARTSKSPEKAPRSPKNEQRLAYFLVLPALAVVGLGLGYPLVQQVIMSFQQFGLRQQFGQPAEFIGLTNYVTILSDFTFWKVLFRSLLLGFTCAILTVVVGTAGAMLLTQVSRKIAVAVQVIMLIAWAMPVLSSLQVFQFIFDARSGVVGWTLGKLGFTSMVGFNWLSQPLSFFFIAAILITWMGVPLVVFMVYASVTQIDESMIEASRLDGANGWKYFRNIVAPSVAPVLLLVSLLQVIWDLRVFTQIYVLQQNSGITEDTNVLGTYVYQIGLSGGNYGLASATAMIMLLVSLLLTWRYITALLKQEGNL